MSDYEKNLNMLASILTKTVASAKKDLDELNSEDLTPEQEKEIIDGVKQMDEAMESIPAKLHEAMELMKNRR